MALRGRLSTIVSSERRWVLPRRALTHSISARPSTLAPLRSVTKPIGVSPHRSEANPDDRGLDNVLVARELGLDVGRIDVEAARDDDVLAPVQEDQKTVLVEAPDVAGPDEAPPFRVAPLGVARLLRLIVISGHDRAGTADHLADVSLGDFVARLVDQANVVALHRLADGVQLVRELMGDEHCRAAAFGHAVDIRRGRRASG